MKKIKNRYILDNKKGLINALKKKAKERNINYTELINKYNLTSQHLLTPKRLITEKTFKKLKDILGEDIYLYLHKERFFPVADHLYLSPQLKLYYKKIGGLPESHLIKYQIDLQKREA